MYSFWVGDRVYLKKSGRQGLIKEVLPNQKLRVQVEGKIIVTSTSNVTVIEDNAFEYPEWVNEPDAKPEKTTGAKSPGNTIDLHMEKLEPAMLHESAAVILQFQLKQCRRFLDICVEKRMSTVQVICGKGEGVLRKEVTHLAKFEYNARFVFEKNQGGMLEIWL